MFANMNNSLLKIEKPRAARGLRLNVFKRYTAASLLINWTATSRAQSNCFGVTIQLSLISQQRGFANANNYGAGGGEMLQIPVKVTLGMSPLPLTDCQRRNSRIFLWWGFQCACRPPCLSKNHSNISPVWAFFFFF